MQQPSREEPQNKEAGSARRQSHQNLLDGNGISNTSTERQVETTDRPLQRSELGLNSDERTEKAVRFSPSLSDVAVVDTMDGEVQLRMVCEHKVEERPGNPEPCWSLAPSLMANSDDTEVPATEKSAPPPGSSSLAVVPVHDGPSFAEVAGSRDQPALELEQEHAFTADKPNSDKTFAQAAESLPSAVQDREYFVRSHYQANEVTATSEENKDDSKTFAQAAAEGTAGAKGESLENGKATEESADGPLPIDPKAAVSFGLVAGDQHEKIETRGEQERMDVVDEDSSAKTSAEATAATATKESLELDPEATTITSSSSLLVAEDGDRPHFDASTPWSPASNKVEPPSPGSSAAGHDSDEDHHSEHSDDTSESAGRKSKNRGLKKTNKKNKNRKRREKSKMDKAASRCQSDPSTSSTGTSSKTPSAVEEDNNERSKEGKVILTVAELLNSGVGDSYSSTSSTTAVTDRDLGADNKIESKGE
ncbi:hypothetical protein EMPS_04633 [Entomortierella parvispora]|uniref:Uncharacterized protein n=1 Tax=Entomortierella parvispora TaxID=205924 RepID=A0A9P3H8T1_9FUNG|nr:hypothetical protein EMPS_04633 [Entomortierella parvispora]